MHSSQMLPPLEGLTAVVAAYRTGSFTAAAESLDITHGAVSRRVQTVERWLGTPLFERHGRGVRPTPAARRFVAQVEQALGAIRDSADRWRPRRELPTVRISVVPSFARLWLMPRLPSLQGQPAEVRIDLQVDHRAVDLSAGESDLAVRYGKGSWPGLRSRLLFGEELFPVAAPAFARSLPSGLKPERLAALPLLHDSDTSQWRAWLAEQGVRFRAKDADRRFEDYDLVLAAAEAGLGVALLRSPLASAAMRSARLVRIARPAVRNAAAHYLVMPAAEQRLAVLGLADALVAMAAGSQR